MVNKSSSSTFHKMCNSCGRLRGPDSQRRYYCTAYFLDNIILNPESFVVGLHHGPTSPPSRRLAPSARDVCLALLQVLQLCTDQEEGKWESSTAGKAGKPA